MLNGFILVIVGVMSRYISSNQLWDKVCEELSFPDSPKGKNNIIFEEEYGKFYLTHYNTGVGIKYSSFVAQFYDDTILENRKTYDSSFLCFNTGENMYMQDALNSKKVNFENNMCWSGEQHEGHLSNSIYRKDKQVVMHFIAFDNTLFRELVKNNCKFQNAKQIYKGDYIDVNFNNHINYRQKTLLEDLLKLSTTDDKLQMLYLESKLLDLVYTSFNAIEITNENENIYLSLQDTQCLQKAKRILLENIKNPPSLKELAYKSAINEFKLKKGFKQLFGNTVYGLLQEHRLCEAKKLLEANEINIGEAAALVGYKSISHFGKVFKEQFNMSPMQIKKQRCFI
ncbi:MAG: AraC family transcriptional regulator [Sulfurovaceae bacterium]